ncbi:hypothetical protein AAHZ94_12490 [Streptomyces sp. HSW2009]|uniref:hypothetical protein n=1 Tax=Streptomyces sp. HSW2009 TaxID=3142890 RepID=UPI0032ED4411
MGVSDQFKDKAEQLQQQAKEKLGKSREKDEDGGRSQDDAQGDAMKRAKEKGSEAKEGVQDTLDDAKRRFM